MVLAVAACSTPKPPPATAPAPKPAPAAPAAKPAWKPAKVVPDAVTVPGGRLHTVKRGETGIAIAQAYGVPWSKVVAANKLKPPYALEVGQKLMLPSTKAAATATANMTVEQRAAAFSVNIDDLITGSAPAERPVTASKAPAAAAEPPSASIALVWPVEGRILSSFGAKPGGRYNDGINLKATKGNAVRAAADGTVAYAGDAIPGFGNLLLIKHPGGWVTAYAHNEALLVTLGTRVRAGEPIARAGASGAVDTPQLHFEVRRGRTAVDPLRYLPPRG
jgi:murein DD-endopeptidase MepM/ murein hydrolase activator NlpD